ncbi:toll/interleukin-1 receptor domain-containing protein [Actinosynnema sp. NPDC023794]
MVTGSPRVFVSYSRRVFYFAEALTAELGATGLVRPWLDVANLRPGTDWSAAIDTALDESDALVLVASPAALRSPYVRDEWQRALAAGKPIHIALVRRTRLPDELSSFPVHDLRGDCRRAARRLAALPPTGHRSVPIAWPVASVHLALLLCLVGLVVGAVFGRHLYDVFSTAARAPRSIHESRYAQFALALAVLNAMVALAIVGLPVKLVRRTVSAEALFVGFLSAAAALALTLTVGGLQTQLHAYETFPDPGPLRATSAAWPYLAGLVAAVIGLGVIRRSRSLHLRMPTGEDQPRGGRRFVPAPAPLPSGPPETFDVRSRPADTPIAAQLLAACEQAGLHRDRTDPHWTFIVVSLRSDLTSLAHAREVFGPGAVFVQATSLELPEDDRGLRRHQWIDFRRQDHALLQAQLRGLAAAPVTVPVAPDRFRGPLRVEYSMRVALGLVAFTAAAPLAQVVAGGGLRVVPAMAITVLLAAVLAPLTRRTATRDVNADQWRLRAVLACVLFAAWNLLPLTGGTAPPLIRIVLVVMLAVSLAGTLRVVRSQWLPPGETVRQEHLTPAVAPKLLGWPMSHGTIAFGLGYLHTLLFAW